MNAPHKSVLVVDDEPGVRMALKANFQRDGWEVETACGAGEAMRKFEHSRYPLVVTDVRMPDGDGLQIMSSVRTANPATAVILLTAFGNVPEAVQAMQGGACDYLVKPISFDQLQRAVRRVMQRPERPAGRVEPRTAAIVGKSPVLLRALERARLAARTEGDILIEAESGTGKELLARFIHASSQRAGKSFVAVNCAAVPEQLLESELFGHVRGAFTGATASKPGKFELADGGTLLLDEIGEMPLPLQPKLLRALQEREIERIGDSRLLPINIRVIATTNVSLQAMVEEGKFRADLYYRLNVIPLTLPPLRDRTEDIGVLAEHFAARFARESGKTAPRLLADFLRALERHNWPGNVRELCNFMRRITALTDRYEIGADFLTQELLGIRPPTIPPRERPFRGSAIRVLERQLVEDTLQATGGNRTRAAEMLGVSLRTIRNKIREYGLPPRRLA